MFHRFETANRVISHHRTMEVKTNRSVPIMAKHGSGVKVTKLNNAYRLTELPTIETKRFQIKKRKKKKN